MLGEKELESGKIAPTLIKLAIPTVIAQVINMLYNVVDRVYIGHMGEEGSLALTGVGVSLPLILFISAFAAFVSSGSAPRLSIYMGKGDKETSEKILGESFTLQLIISTVLTVVLVLFNRPLLLLFGASDKTIGYASSYMTIYALGTIFVEMTLGLNAFITAEGKTTVSMLTVLIGALLNIALDPLFIFVFNLGVKGAAIATVISQAVSALWCVFFLRSKKSQLKLDFSLMKLEKKIILPSFLLGVSTFIMQSTESLISICFNSSLLKYGGDIAVGAMTIASSVMQMALLPLQGIGQGAQPLTSFNYGRGNIERVKKSFKTLLAISFSYTFVVWIFIMATPSFFASVFASNKSLIEYSSKVLRIYCFSLFLMSIQISCQMTFVAIGVALSSVIVAVVRKIVLLIPLIYIVPLFVSDKAVGVFLAEPIADILAVTFTIILFLNKFPKALKEKKIS